jgi:hypothetical protein
MAKTFNSEALPKILQRFQKAKAALHQCRNAKNFDLFTSAWSDFLVATGGIMNLLEAGAKDTPQGRQWYGGIKRSFNADPLLKYMFQARNAEEHTADAITSHHADHTLTIGDPGETVHIGSLSTGRDFWRDPVGIAQNAVLPTGPDNSLPTIRYSPAGPRLDPVTDNRFKTTFAVPTTFLGGPLKDSSPITIGTLYLTHLEGIIKDVTEMN